MKQTEEELKRQADIDRLIAYSKTLGLLKPFEVIVEANGSWDIKFLNK